MLSDRISRISPFGSSDVGLHTSRTPLRKIGRMYTSPSMDRLTSMDRSRPLLTRTQTLTPFDVSNGFERFNSFTSSPISHRSSRYQDVRTSVWRQSELKKKSSLHRSRPDLSMTSTDAYSSATYSPISSRFSDPVAVLDRRDQFFHQLNAISSPKVNRRVVPQSANRSAVRHHWSGVSNITQDVWRPRMRERPLLANLSASILSRSKNSRKGSGLGSGRSSKTSSTSSLKVEESISPERRDSSGIYRNKYIIKFREHNLGQTPSQRRSSITWDLPKAFTSVKGSEESPITELLEPDPHLGIKDAESETKTQQKESVSQGINESDISGINQNAIKNDGIVSERVSDAEVVDKSVLSESEPKCNASHLVIDILSVETTASVMPEPSGGPVAPLLQKASSLKSKPCDEKCAETVPKSKSPKKKKVKKKEKTTNDKDVIKEEEKSEQIVCKKEKLENISPKLTEVKVCKDINENIVTEVKSTENVSPIKKQTLRQTVTTPLRIKFRKYTFDDFNLLKVLGRGSFGKVFLAELKEHNIHFAIKCLKKHSVIEDDDIDSIMIERKVLAYGSAHPFICKLFCTFQTESYLCFAMEWCSGGDLMFHIQKFGKFDEERARFVSTTVSPFDSISPSDRFYASEILCAIKFMHNKGIIYRDLKLDNIMIDHKGHLRLVDFGMCQGRIYREDLLPSNFCGTPEYMAPEIIKGVKYNQSVDFWSLGVVIYEMVVGTSPFHGTDEDELLWNVCHEEVVYPRYLSENIKNLLVLLLNKNPEQRLGMTTCPSGDIYNQSFFKSVDWVRVEKCQMKPPFVPELSSPSDVSYFEPYFTKENPNLTPVSDETTLTIDQTVFQGFSYTNHKMTD